MMAAQHWAERFAHLLGPVRLQLECDSAPAVLALEAAYSPSPVMMESISAVRKLFALKFVNLRVRHIHGDVYNLVSDALSHDRIPEARWRAMVEFGVSLTLLQ